MSQLRKISKIFKEFVEKHPKSFLLLFFLLLLEGIVAASSVLAVIPLADFLFDSKLKNPSNVTLFIVDKFLILGIPINFWAFGIFFASLNLLNGVFKVFVRYAILNIKYSILRSLYSDTLERFFNTKWSFFSEASHGKLLNTMNKELVRVGAAIGHITTQFAQVVQLFIYLSIPLWLNASMTIIALVIVTVFGILFLRLNKLSYKFGQMATSFSNIALGVLSEILQAARIILGFGKQNDAKSRYIKAFDDYMKVTIKTEVLLNVLPNFFMPLGILATVIAFGISLHQGHHISELTAVLWSLLSTMPILSTLLRTQVSINNFVPSYEQLLLLRKKATEHKQIDGNTIFKELVKGIRFNNVCFSYPDRKTTISNLDLYIAKGKMTALVGESGSGKSTIADLLLGLQIPYEGSVLIDEIPLSDYKQQSYRKRVGYVPQEPILFHSSIRDNLLWSSGSSSEEELWTALDVANATLFVKQLPQGIDTIVGDRGTRMSGGQRQRIALARALLRKPDLLILDEATSALDNESERLIQESIDSLSENTTILIVAHRLSTIKNADQVYVMQNGRIIENGSYAELNNNPESVLNKK
ncbi:ABC transporter ATP-binding protein/permease [Candidatus Thioglobus sp.]|nr:ABC transporter ATP-binding protein/permease [Candidatus Thioglobus sp.]